MSRGQRGGIIFRLLGLLFLCLFLACVYVVRHPLMRVAARGWIVADPLQRADVIVVLGDDNFDGDRAAHAADLFHAGWAPEVVASGRELRSYASLSDLIQQDLDRDGVPPGAIVAFPNRAQETIEEAQALRQFAAESKWQSLIIVTSNYHTRRTRYIYGKVFPRNVRIMVSPAFDSEFDPASWWTSRHGQRLFAHELLGYPEAMWELRGSQAN